MCLPGLICSAQRFRTKALLLDGTFARPPDHHTHPTHFGCVRFSRCILSRSLASAMPHGTGARTSNSRVALVLSTILFLLATAAYLTTTTTKTRDASPTHLIGPLVLTASVLSYDRVLLSWNAIPTAGSFNVWRMRHPSQRFEVNSSVGQGLSHKVMVRPSTTYTFKVNTWLPSGVWIESNNVTVTTPDTPSTSDGWPAPTLELTADAVLTVRWLPLKELEQQTAASLPPVQPAWYTVLWRRSNDAESMQWFFMGTTRSTYELRYPDLLPNATYDIRVAFAHGTPTEVLSPIATITIPAHRS